MIKNIDKLAKENSNFRKVLETGENTQIVVMSIPVGGEIGEEVHNENDQVLYVVDGEGKVVIEGADEPFVVGDMILVKKGTRHNFVNSGDRELKIITIYSPPHHPDGTIHATKEDADKAEY